MIRKILLISALPLLMLSCKKDPAIQESVVKETEETVVDSVETIPADSLQTDTENKLGKFGFPPEVEGCSCYFAENKADFENEQFVYVDDYGNNATIRVNGKNVKIPMDEGDFDPANFSKTIENADYLVEMTGSKIDEGYETMLFRGTMKVTDKKSKEVYSTPVYGECGC